jgi:hypothetical protein
MAVYRDSEQQRVAQIDSIISHLHRVLRDTRVLITALQDERGRTGTSTAVPGRARAPRTTASREPHKATPQELVSDSRRLLAGSRTLLSRTKPH